MCDTHKMERHTHTVASARSSAHSIETTITTAVTEQEQTERGER